MEQKKPINVKLSTAVLSIIVVALIVVIAYFVIQNNNLKNKQEAKETEVAQLKSEVSNLETKIGQIRDVVEEPSNTQSKIEIEGSYSEGAVGYVYEFHKDGTVKEGDELVTSTGTYKTTGSNEVEVVLTEKTTSNTDTSEKKVEKINEKYTVTIVNNNTLKIAGERNGEKYSFEVTKINNTTSTAEWVEYPSNEEMKSQLNKWAGAENFVNDEIKNNKDLKGIYSLSKKYNDALNIPFTYYYSDWGDSTNSLEIDCNYETTNGMVLTPQKYTKTLKYSIAELNEGLSSINGGTTYNVENQYNNLVVNKEYGHYYSDKSVPQNFYFEATSILFVNGNTNSKTDYMNNSRVKKIKVTVNGEKEYIFDVKDTNDVQVFDLNYRQNTIQKAVDIEVEVLETYKGETTNDVYFSGFVCGLESNLPSGR